MVRSSAEREEEEATELGRFLRAGTHEGERPQDRDLWAFLVLRLGDESELEVAGVEEESEPEEVEVEGDAERDRRFLFCLVEEERP